MYRVLNFEDTVILYLLCILKKRLPQKFAENRTYTHILCTRRLWSEESAQGLWWHIFQNWPPGGNVFWFNWILTYVLAYPQPMKVGSTYCSHQFSVDERIWSRVSMWTKGWTWHFGINYWFGLDSNPHFQKPENILDGVYYHVLGTCGSATTSPTLYFHATGYWPISHTDSLGETSLTYHTRKRRHTWLNWCPEK